MRKVKINNDGELQEGKWNIICPFLYSNATMNEPIGVNCHTNCAWFRIEEQSVTTPDSPPEKQKFAFCGDKLIGEIEDSS